MFVRLLAAGSSVALVLVLAACSTGPSYSKEVLEDYFSAIASTSPEDQLEAQKVAVPGSNADAYAIEQSAHSQAQMDGGTLRRDKQEVLYESDEVLLCAPGFEDPDVDRDDFCISFSNFEFEDEKLLNFNAGSEPLDGRIALGDGTTVPIADLGSAKHLTSYVTIGGDLVVTIEVTSNANTLRLPYSAAYLSPNGRQAEVSFIDGPSELKEGRIGNAAYWFSGAAFGGTLELSFDDENWNPVAIEIPTE